MKTHGVGVGVKRRGMTVSVMKWDSHKLPVLVVHFDGEDGDYKVASFNDDDTALWFIECMRDTFFSDAEDET